jgi:arylsulfatase A-like enzyme
LIAHGGQTRRHRAKDQPNIFPKRGPRGVLKCAAATTDDPTVDPRFGRVGKQRIEDTGPLTKKRMETIDDETTNAAADFIQRQVKAGKPFFVWMNTTRMHVYTHVRPSMRGQSGMPDNEYADGMIEHDGMSANF